MAYLPYEYFCYFVYDIELSYEEIMSKEERLTFFVQQILNNFDAIHLDFTPVGDGLQVQCSFEDMNDRKYNELCEALSNYTCDGISVKFLLISRDLKQLQGVMASDKKFQKYTFTIPPYSN